MAKTGMAPNSWKIVSLQKVSQTDALALRDSQEFKTVLNSISTGILEVCECRRPVNWFREVPICLNQGVI